MLFSYLLAAAAFALGPALAAPVLVHPESLTSRSLSSSSGTGTVAAVMVHKRDVEAKDLERRDWTSVFKLGLPTGKVALKAAGKSAGKSGGSNFFNVFSKIGSSFASLKVQKPQAKKFAAAAKPVVKSTPKPVKSTPKPIAKSAPKPSPPAKGWRSIVAKAAEKAKNARQSAKAKLVVKDEAHEQAKQFIQQSIASPGFKPEEFGLEAKHYSREWA